MNRYRPLRSLLPSVVLAAALGCVRSAAVGAEPVIWSCRVAAPAASAADFCPAIGAALETGLRNRDPDRAVAALAPDAPVDAAALNLVIELVTASDRSLSARLLWQAPNADGQVAGPVLTLDVVDRSLDDADLRATLASQIAANLLSHGGAPL